MSPGNLGLGANWLALLVVLAGCGGFGAGSPAPPSVTPVPLPSDRSQPTVAGNLPPGVSETGITNVTALSRAHAGALAGTSFTRHTTLTIRYPNGTVLQGANRTLRMGASDDRFYYREIRRGSWAERPGDPVRVTVWSTADVVHRVTRLRNGAVLYATNREAAVTPRQVTRPSGKEVRRVFDGVDVAVIAQGDANGSSVVVAANDAASTVLPLFPAPHGSAELRARVSETGLVSQIRVESVSRRGTQTLRLQWSVRYSAIGETNVESLDRTPSVNITASAD